MNSNAPSGETSTLHSGKISEVLLSENRIELEVEIIHFPCYSMDCKPLLGCQVAEDIGG